MAFTGANPLIVKLIATFRLIAPAELNTMLPEILPGAAEAAERTYITVLFTIPPD